MLTRDALQAAAEDWGVVLPSDDETNPSAEPRTDSNTDDGGARLKAFRTAHPVVLTHDEQGNPIAQATGLAATFHRDADEEDLVFDADV